MSEPTSVPASETGSDDLPEFEAVREKDRELQEAIDADDLRHPGEDLVESARELLAEAKSVGKVTWRFHDRDELDAIARRAARIIRRSGERVEPVQIESYDGGLPTFELMDVEEFKKELRSGPVVGRRLENADLRGFGELERHARLEIMDCAFIGCDFGGLDLSGARILHSVFDGCDFANADFSDAFVTSSLIKGTSDDDGQGGEGFRNICAKGANFSGSRLDLLTLGKADFTGAAFSYAYLSRIHASEETTFAHGVFDLATVEGVAASGADFSGALFIGGNLVNVDFTGANLEGAVFSSGRVGGTVFHRARLKGASFSNAYFVSSASFDDETDLAEVEFNSEDEKKIRAQLHRQGKADIGEKPTE